jgi:thermostable 8-oxoguanine DNA glycosylase
MWLTATVNSGIDLKTCTVDDLESIPGIGPKTARCFLIHSRPNQQLGALDTHILRYMREQGYDVPKSTPSSKKYKEVEKKWLKLANEISKKTGKTLAEVDLDIWRKYAR